MARFSQRIGIVPVRTAIQGRDLDDVTRTRLWNAFAVCIPEAKSVHFSRTWMHEFCGSAWASLLQRPIDELNSNDDRAVRQVLKDIHLTSPWHEVYDLVEFTMQSKVNQVRGDYCREVAVILREELAGFRVINAELVEITDEVELRSLEDALRATAVERFGPARIHIESSLALLSDRRAPDYRNAIKEAVSAVEAVVQILAKDPKAELGVGLKVLERRVPLHGAFRRALLALYGYTSDADGIRHALSDEPSVDFADAKFMVVVCAAFVVLLIQKSAP